MSVVSSDPCGLVVVDADGVIRHWDSGAQELFGYTIAEAEGQRLDFFVPDGDRQWNGSAVLERPVKCSDGTIRPFAARRVSMTDPGDHPVGAAMIFVRQPATAAAPRATTAPGYFDAIARHRFVNLATRRKNGEMVATPMWFAVAGDVMYMNTDQRSWKVKRIRNDPYVTLQPCTSRGKLRSDEKIEAVAAIVPRDQRASADAVLLDRYGWQRKVFRLFHRERIDQYSELIEIRPPGTVQA